MNAITMPVSEIENSNLAIWTRNEKTDPAFAKAFSKAGGFRGTAICPTYTIQRLTREFGPAGRGWGADVIDEQMVTGAPILTNEGVLLGHETIHNLRISFWWIDPSTQQRHSFEQFGATLAVGRDKRGLYTEVDAAKMSLTDAVTKAASWLGFSSDVHLGKFDDSKYVSERAREEKIAQADDIIDGKQKPPSAKPPTTTAAPTAKPPAPDQLRQRVDRAVAALAAAAAPKRLEQLQPAAEALLAELVKAKRNELRTELDKALSDARKRLVPVEPELDDDPFGMPEAA